MITHTDADAIGAPDAFVFAGITYRRLDYWARRGWVKPSVEAGTGRPGRRLYSAVDVVRLAALGHLGRSGADVGLLGPRSPPSICLPATPTTSWSSAWPVGGGGPRRRAARPRQQPRSHMVFDPAPLRRQLNLFGCEEDWNRKPV